MSNKSFLDPIFKGERFSGHSIPLEVLPDLKAYRDLVVEVAKELYLADNTDKKRVPRRFMESFNLVLTGINEGSTVAQIERVSIEEALFSDGSPDYFEEARDLISGCIENIGAGSPPPPRFPKNQLPYFNNFGRQLRPGESIMLCKPGSKTGPVYDQEIRKKLILSEALNYQHEASEVGSIVEIDTRALGFVLRREDGVDLKGHYQQSMESSVFDAARMRNTVRVRVAGIGLYDKNDVIQRFDEVSHITQVGPNALQDRVNELLDLPDGWNDGEGTVLDTSGAQWASDVLQELMSAYEIPQPYIYPTPEGGLQAEWSSSAWEVRMNFHFPDKVAKIRAVHVLGTQETGKLTTHVSQHVNQIAEFLRQHIISEA